MHVTVEHYMNGNIFSIECRNDKDQLHNHSGPAIQHWCDNGQEIYRAYWINGKLHNEEGPAAQRWHENGQEAYRAYFINDKELTAEEFNKIKNTIEITVGDKTKRISRESAKALNLI